LGSHAVELEGVTAVYEGERIPALHGISLLVEAGELVGIVGPNGAGKTTLLEVINGLLPITSGKVRVLGQRVLPSSHRLRRRIAYLPQDLFFEPPTPFLAKDVVLMGRYAKVGAFRFPGKSDRSLAREAMREVGILDLVERPIGRLSGGQQRKALLARVLAKRPQVLLLDEPTASLDPASKEEISRLVLQIHHELSLATLTVSHEAGPLLDCADRVLTIEKGCLVSDAPGNSGAVPIAARAQFS